MPRCNLVLTSSLLVNGASRGERQQTMTVLKEKTDEELKKQQQTPLGRRLKDVLNLAHSMLAEHGLQNWRISFDHARRRAGSCNFSTKTISLSRHYAREAPLDHIKDTILHEIAHALVGPSHGSAFYSFSIS